jgi:TrkA domain protein
MSVYETELPGVGRKFELDLGEGGARVIVVLHHDGHCELFHRAAPDAEERKLVSLSGEQANKLGSILEGAYFESVDIDQLTAPLGESIIQWIEIRDTSPIVDATLAEAAIEERTGASVIAIQRGTDTLSDLDGSVTIRVGDHLIALGSREQQNELAELAER